MRQGSVPLLYVATVTSTPSQDGGVVWLLTTPHYSSLLPTRQRGSHCHHKVCDRNDKKLPGPISISTLSCSSPPLTVPRMVDAGGREADWCVVMRGPARLLWYSDRKLNFTIKTCAVPDHGPTLNIHWLSSFPSLCFPITIIPHWKGFNTGNKEKTVLAL